MNRFLLLLYALFAPSLLRAGDPFEIRGVLPWHNFLCGPSTWNEQDYADYLDRCHDEGINFIGFHNYTGGGERYASYVEPMIAIRYEGITPQAYFDHSESCRWGYLPLSLEEFPFDTATVLETAAGAHAFGSDVTVTARTTDDHYRGARHLMRRVLEMAHERGMRMAMGFEFGVVPPEYFSLNAGGNGNFYWLSRGGMIPDPCHRISTGLHEAALDNLVENYPQIDYVWLWLNEHSFFGVDVEEALKSNPLFAEHYREKAALFSEAATDTERFIGVWSLVYLEKTLEWMQRKGVQAKLVLGGWGGGNQLPALLKGLDRALPQQVIFSCLNPALGTQPQPAFLEEIALHRDVWIMPWLEGDHQLWHAQPRVKLLGEHVRMAARQGAKGVVAIHWRTEDIRHNFNTFARLATDPDDGRSVEAFYTEYYTDEFGSAAARQLAPLMARADEEQLHASVQSPEFYAFTPGWGHLNEENVALRRKLLAIVDEILPQTADPVHIGNLRHFRACYAFELLLDRVTRAMAPAWELRRRETEEGDIPTQEACLKAAAELSAAPVEELIRTYASRVRSRGEMGVLSSVVQRLWGSYRSLETYLESKTKQTEIA